MIVKKKIKKQVYKSLKVAIFKISLHLLGLLDTKCFKL